jgi:O-antigen ligase
MAPANIALGACLGLFLIHLFRRHRAGAPFLALFRPVPLVLPPILAFMAVSVVAAVLSTKPARSIGEIKGLVTLLLVPVGLVLIRHSRDGWLLVSALRLTHLMICFRAALELSAGDGDLQTRLTGGLSNHMTFAGLLMPLTLVLAASALDSGRSRQDRLLDSGLAVFGVVLLALSLTRSAYLGFFAGVVVLLLFYRPKLVWILPAALVMALAISPAGVKDRARSIVDSQDPTSRDRLHMWTAGTLMIRDHPLTGVGPGRVKELYPDYRQPGFVDPHPGHLHNNLVMIAAETGLPSLAVYLWFVAAVFTGAYRARRSGNTSGLIFGAAAALAALFVAGQFEYNFGDVEILRLTLLLSILPFRVDEAPRLVEANP